VTQSVIQPGATRQRCLIALALIAGALLVSIEPAVRYGRAVSLLLAVVGADDPSGITHLLRHEVRARETSLALPARAIRTRVYTPIDDQGRSRVRARALVLHGVHPDAIDEPRLQAFAKALAAIGVETYTPELKELAQQRVLPSTIDDIGACAQEIEASVGEKPGALGISFAGGLLLLAAAREPGANALRYVVTVGAHHDLRRVLRYYAGAAVTDPEGKPAPVLANPYGGRVMATAYAELFFEPGDLPVAKEALSSWLQGRYREARTMATTLTKSGQARFDTVTDNARRGELNELLLKAASAKQADLLAVSPAQGLSSLRVPTFLVHGQADPIVPALETRWLAREVPALTRPVRE